jgi:hypothetical protein
LQNAIATSRAEPAWAVFSTFVSVTVRKPAFVR